MSRYSKAALFGCIIGLLGVVASLLPVVDECDQAIGLYALFSTCGGTGPPRPRR